MPAVWRVVVLREWLHAALLGVLLLDWLLPLLHPHYSCLRRAQVPVLVAGGVDRRHPPVVAVLAVSVAGALAFALQPVSSADTGSLPVAALALSVLLGLAGAASP